MTRSAIAVTGMGLVGPGGIGVEANWQAALAGTATAAQDEALAGLPVRISCRVPAFDADRALGARQAHRLDRSSQFALLAAREAVADAGLDPGTWDGARTGVAFGTAGGGAGTFEAQHRTLLDEGPHRVSPLTLPMHLPNMVAGQLGIDLGARGPNLTVSTACASAATAIQTACDLLQLGRCDVVVTGGSDALLTSVTMAAFAQMGALSRHTDPATASRPFDLHRDGFVAGEGAGVLVLERLSDAAARGARVHGRIVGCGSTADAHHVTAPDPQGQGMEGALRQALADADAAPGDVDHVNAHGTSTPQNDRLETEMLRRVLPGDPPVTSAKGVMGHLLGAAGAMEAILTLRTLREQKIPATANLTTPDPAIRANVVAGRPLPHPMELAVSNSFGFGGQNAVLVLAR
ncbi:beta-ketoacyl-[acyl-carrier-protein] synthase family protein [Streptomyces axinellae]|uniref:Beta-ketoacyl-[acyl-carrier-protein] synthase family protein n=1 Tax=Streptomyces axinellae TaxID=552788 RepID=A0ABP6CWJ7_9ACTN